RLQPQAHRRPEGRDLGTGVQAGPDRSRHPGPDHGLVEGDTMHDGFHPPLEEYLEAIYELQEEGTPVIQARLAERLGHAPPSVSEMIGRLRGDAYLEAEGRALRLTSKAR